MEIRSIKHKALKTLYESDPDKAVKGLDASLAKKIRSQITMLEAATTLAQVQSMPGWKLHELTPKFPGKWSMWVSGNYRLTFKFDRSSGVISDLDFEDYH